MTSGSKAAKPKRKYKTYRERRDEAEAKRQARIDANLPDPVWTRKSAIVLAVLLIGYATYVFIARVCVPMIRKEYTARGSRRQGIVLLSFFLALFCMVMWTYIRVLTKGPGYVQDYIEVTLSPELEEPQPIAGPPYGDIPIQSHNGNNPGQQSGQANSIGTLQDIAAGPPIAAAFGPATGGIATMSVQKQSNPQPNSKTSNQYTVYSHNEPLPAESVGQTKTGSGLACSSIFKTSDEQASNIQEKPINQSEKFAAHMRPHRHPNEVPVLQPYYRWCTRCERVKPYRSHHCRHCGTCILKMDHHCPWIGGCVGAQNHRYYFLFLQWSSVWTLYLFLGTLLAIVPPHRPAHTERRYVDPQHIILLIIAFTFALFTGSLFITHLRGLLLNITTIEEIGIRRMIDKERASLTNVYGLLAWRQHRHVKRIWTQEWGRLRFEGNPWWLGSYSANWKVVFGSNKLAWFIPIPARPHDDEGLEYELNPRYTTDGVWLPRNRWPKELR